MKSTLWHLLLFLIVVQYSCVKPDNTYLEIEDYEIVVINDNNSTSYKFNSNGYPLLFQSDNWYYSYSYNQYIPIETELKINNDSVKLMQNYNFEYNENLRTLIQTKNTYFYDSVTIYKLKDDLSIANYIMNKDTTFYHYNYTNRLDAIEYNPQFMWANEFTSTKSIDSLIYDEYNNLVEVRSSSPLSKYRFIYDTKNRLTEILFNDQPISVYTYTFDNKLLSVNGKRVVQKNNFTPINLQPAKYFRFKYLELGWIK